VTGPDAVVNVPFDGVEAKLTILSTPNRMAKQKSAQAIAARKTKRPERELNVFSIGLSGLHDERGSFLFVQEVKNGRLREEKFVYSWRGLLNSR
jgi:hypothetical protein